MRDVYVRSCDKASYMNLLTGMQNTSLGLHNIDRDILILKLDREVHMCLWNKHL